MVYEGKEKYIFVSYSHKDMPDLSAGRRSGLPATVPK